MFQLVSASTSLIPYKVESETRQNLAQDPPYAQAKRPLPSSRARNPWSDKDLAHCQKEEDAVLERLKSIAEAIKKDGHSAAFEDVYKKIEQDIAAEVKYKEEFMTGVPQKIKELKPEEEAKKKEKREKDLEQLKLTSKAVGLDIVTRLIYQTHDEKVLYAKKKSIKAHLDQLVAEGKIKQVEEKILLPVMAGSEVKEPAPVNVAWQAVEDHTVQ
jgi:hypothetical protein